MRIRSLLSAALLGSASLFVVAAPAQATPHCSTSYFLCVFQNRDFGGGLLQTSQSNTNWDYLGNPAAFRRMNDEDSAAANSTTRTYARIYEHDGYTGGSYCVRPQQEIAYVGDGYNDEGSSHRFLSAC